MNRLENQEAKLEVFVPLRINLADAALLDRAVASSKLDRSKVLRQLIRSLVSEASAKN